MVELGVATISFGPPFNTRVDGCGNLKPHPPEPKFPGISPTAFNPSEQMSCYADTLKKEKQSRGSFMEAANRMEDVRYHPNERGSAGRLGDILPGYESLVDYGQLAGFVKHPISGNFVPAPAPKQRRRPRGQMEASEVSLVAPSALSALSSPSAYREAAATELSFVAPSAITVLTALSIASRTRSASALGQPGAPSPAAPPAPARRAQSPAPPGSPGASLRAPPSLGASLGAAGPARSTSAPQLVELPDARARGYHGIYRAPSLGEPPKAAIFRGGGGKLAAPRRRWARDASGIPIA